MVQEPFAPPQYREGIDADAVCGQCGTANPEGTLLCKTCGNNLRDQRLLRMTADQILDAETEGTGKSSFLLAALPILGLLLLLWFGLNAGRISSVLTTAGNTSQDYTLGTNPGVFWEGEGGEVYETLQQALTSRFPTIADAEAARLESSPSATFVDGVYVLYERRGTTERFAGAAAVRFQEGTWYYVAHLNGEVQVRGMAKETEQVLVSQWDQAGMLYGGAYYATAGQAYRMPDGTVNVSGSTDLDGVQHASAAYRLRAL